MGRGKSLSVGSATSRECMEETTCNRLQPRRHVGGKTQNTGKKQIKGPGRARNNRACPVCVLVKRMGIEGPEKGCASPECDSIPVSGARAQAGPPVSSRRRPQPGPALLTCGPCTAGTGRKCQPRSSPPVRSSRPSPTHFRGRSRPPGGFGLSGV